MSAADESLNIDPIKARHREWYANYGPAMAAIQREASPACRVTAKQAARVAADVPALIAEIERLRQEADHG